MRKRVLAAISFQVAWVSPADALCIYHGVDNARTTLEQEFEDSRWVVRAHPISADYHWANVGENWTLYSLRVVHRFKGNLPQRFRFYTKRDSGARFGKNKQVRNPS